MIRLNIYLLLVFFLTCVKSISFDCVESYEAVHATCIVKDVADTPWNRGDQVPAPQPSWVNGAIVVEKNMENKTQKFIMKMKWKQKASILRRFVTGYYIEIKPGNSNDGYKKIFEIEQVEIQQVEDDEWVFFKYDHFGDTILERINGDTRYSISLHSLPMYSNSEGHQNPSKIHHIIAPSCPTVEELDGFEMKVCSYLLQYPDYFPYDDDYAAEVEMSGKSGDNEEEKQTTKNKITVLPILLTSILFIGFLLFIIYKKRDELRNYVNDEGYHPATQTPLSGENDGIVILVPTLGVEGRPPVWELTQKLASYLHNDDVMVTCNLWHQHTTSAHQWLSDVIAHHRSCGVQSHVVLMQSGGGTVSEGGATDAYQIFNEKLKDSHTHSIVHFDDDVIPRTTSSSHHFHLPRDVIKLICELTNASCKDDDVIVSELKQLATKVRMTSHQQV